MRDLLEKLAGFSSLSYDEARHALSSIVEGRATRAQASAFLVALRMKGETVDELAAMASFMRDRCVKVELDGSTRAVDTCGTGGDMVKTFNVSTVSSFVAAGAGAKVAKHGNRSFTGCCGSADLMEYLGVNIEAPPHIVKKCVESVGIGFMFAPMYHPAMKSVAIVRKEIGIRTAFNVLGPLTNPAGVRSQLVGVYDESLVEKLARVASIMGYERVMVVHGLEGMDEVSVHAPTKVAYLNGGSITTYELHPRDLGIDPVPLERLVARSKEESLGKAYRVIAGICSKDSPEVKLSLVNAAAALVVAGLADTVKEALPMAEESVYSGLAYRKVKELVRVSGGNIGKLEEVEEKYG